MWCNGATFSNPLRGLPSREHPLERVPMDSEDPRGLSLVALDALHDAQHDLTLERLRGLLQGQSLGRAELETVLGQEDVERQLVERREWWFRQAHDALDHRSELG